MVDYPNCGLLNADAAGRRDCGHDLAGGPVQRPYGDGPPPERTSSGRVVLRAIAAVWGFLAGGFVCLIAGWLAFWWTVDSGRGLNAALPLVGAGALQMGGAVLAVFRPLAGGVVMMLAAAATMVFFAIDIGGQALLLAGVGRQFLSMAALVILPGILALLSARSPRGGRRFGRPSGSAGPSMAA